MAPLPAFQAAEALFYAANICVRPQLPHQRHHVQCAFGGAKAALHPQASVGVNKVAEPGCGTTVDDDAMIAALLLPHIGSATMETWNAMGCLVLEGIAAVFGKKD